MQTIIFIELLAQTGIIIGLIWAVSYERKRKLIYETQANRRLFEMKDIKRNTTPVKEVNGFSLFKMVLDDLDSVIVIPNKIKKQYKTAENKTKIPSYIFKQEVEFFVAKDFADVSMILEDREKVKEKEEKLQKEKEKFEKMHEEFHSKQKKKRGRPRKIKK